MKPVTQLITKLRPCIKPRPPSQCTPVLRNKFKHQCESARKLKAQESVQASFTEILSRSSDIIMRINPRNIITYFSPEGCAQLGFSPDEIQGKSTFEFVHPEDAVSIRNQMYAIRDSRKPGRVRTRLRCSDGAYLWYESEIHYIFDGQDRLIEIISITSNSAPGYSLDTKILRTAAFSDSLTGLDNRYSFLETIGIYMAASQSAPFTLFNIDLDRFKQVNDSLGHAAGDSYLVEVSRRLKQSLPHNSFLARLGGDEFVALIPVALTPQDAMNQALSAIDSVSQPFSCKGVVLYPSISVGISFSKGASSSEEVLSQADVAMYYAKKQGGNNATVYDISYDTTFKQAFKVEAELVTAIRTHNVVVQYQPIVSASSKIPCFSEALVRIRKPDGSILPPGYFITVAENSGLIYELGQIVLQQACYQIKRLASQGVNTVISVNVAPKQLMHVNYIQSVKSILKETAVSPGSVILEVTESAIMDEPAKALAILKELRSMGFILALDDFGQGYSSLSMLKNFPFDILKIDRSFVMDANPKTAGANPLSAIIDIGKMFKLSIVAEGIETQEQSDNVSVLGCDFIQGYLYHQPIAADSHFQLCLKSHAPLELRRFESSPATDSVNLF